MLCKYVIIHTDIDGYGLEAADLIEDERRGYLNQEEALNALDIASKAKDLPKGGGPIYNTEAFQAFQANAEKDRKARNDKMKREMSRK